MNEEAAPLGADRDPLRLAGGVLGASAVLIGALTWAYAVLVQWRVVGGDFCLETTCGDPDPALAIGLGVPAGVGILAALALCVRMVGACARPSDERWRGVRKAAALAAVALGIWAGIIAALAFL